MNVWGPTWSFIKAYWRQPWSDTLSTLLHAIPVRAAIATVLLAGVIGSSGCKKPEDDLGLAVLDPTDTLGTVRTDTISILTWPHADLPVRTSGLSTNEVGSYVDDVFGPVFTGTVTQLRLSVNNIGPADPTLVCDSLVLSLAFSTTEPTYGDLDPQVIRVYRLNEDLHLDSIYKSDRLPFIGATDQVKGAPLTITPAPLAGPVIGGDTLVPQVRIPLSNDLGSELLAQWGQSTLADNASFLAWFKGLAIVPDNAGQATLDGGVWRFNLLSGASKMTLYYHNGEGTSQSFDFIIGSSSARYTYGLFDHTAASTPELPAALADSTLGQVVTYVQSLGGVRTELRFPFLERYQGSPYQALAKAELIVPIAGEHYSTYLPPAQLFAFRKGDAGEDLLVPDQVAGQGMVGGLYDAEEGTYRFNLTRWVQGVISGTYPNTGLALVAGSNGVSVNRAAFAGPLNGGTPMKMVLTFTTY